MRGGIRPVYTRLFSCPVIGHNCRTRYATRASKDALPVRVRQRRPRISSPRFLGLLRQPPSEMKRAGPPRPALFSLVRTPVRPVEVKTHPTNGRFQEFLSAPYRANRKHLNVPRTPSSGAEWRLAPGRRNRSGSSRESPF